jgi:FMN reductase
MSMRTHIVARTGNIRRFPMTTIAVVSAGLSEPSSSRLLADRLAAAAASAFDQDAIGVHEGTRLVHIDLRPLAHDITDAMLTRFNAPALQAAIDTVLEADALVFVAPVFTAGMSGLAKSFLDVLDPDALADMPVLIGATGGTARHSLAIEHGIRPVFAYLRAAVAPTAVFAATDDWGGEGDGSAALDARIRRAGADLAWVMRASRRVQPADELSTPDFGSLLGSLGH